MSFHIFTCIKRTVETTLNLTLVEALLLNLSLEDKYTHNKITDIKEEVIRNLLLQILVNFRCAPKVLNWRRIGKIIRIRYPLDKLHLFSNSLMIKE